MSVLTVPYKLKRQPRLAKWKLGIAFSDFLLMPGNTTRLPLLPLVLPNSN